MKAAVAPAAAARPQLSPEAVTHRAAAVAAAEAAPAPQPAVAAGWAAAR